MQGWAFAYILAMPPWEIEWGSGKPLVSLAVETLCPFRTTWLNLHHLATRLLQSCSIPRPRAKIECAFSKQMRWAEEWVQHSTPQLPEEMGFELEDLNSTQSWTEELGTERIKLKHFNAAWHLNLQISLWLCINNTYTEVNSNKNKQKKKQQLSMSCQ